MENKKRMAFNLIFLAAVFAATVYGVFHGADMNQLADAFTKVNPFLLAPGVCCVLVFIWGESIIIYYMMKTLGIRLKK